MRTASCRPDSGFSTLELLTVVVISLVLMAWSYPNLATLSSKYRLDGAAWSLATEIQKTRLRAIAESCRFQIVFDSTQRSYQVRKETVPGTFANDGPARGIDDANTIGLSATANPIFTSRGALEPGTTSVVTLSGQTGGVRLVAVQQAGRIRVQ